MAITSCPECNGKLSTSAASCPHCGYAAGSGIASPPATSPAGGERTFFTEGGVTVTQQRFIVPHQTYALNLISSVRVETIAPSRGFPGLLLVGGLAGIGMGVSQNNNGSVLTWSIIAAAVGLIWMIKMKPTYWVVVQTAGAETRALSSQKWNFINRIVEALNEAIVARG